MTEASLRNGFFLLLFVLVGCDSASPTAVSPPLNVQVQDIVGTWQYNSRHARPAAKINIDFQEGTFVQKVHVSGSSQILIHSGKWNLDMDGSANVLMLKDVLMYLGNRWQPTQAGFLIQKSSANPSQIAILGSDHPDPDAFEELVRLPLPLQKPENGTRAEKGSEQKRGQEGSVENP
jgi:hypothetical protein